MLPQLQNTCTKKPGGLQLLAVADSSKISSFRANKQGFVYEITMQADELFQYIPNLRRAVYSDRRGEDKKHGNYYSGQLQFSVALEGQDRWAFERETKNRKLSFLYKDWGGHVRLLHQFRGLSDFTTNQQGGSAAGYSYRFAGMLINSAPIVTAGDLPISDPPSGPYSLFSDSDYAYTPL